MFNTRAWCHPVVLATYVADGRELQVQDLFKQFKPYFAIKSGRILGMLFILGRILAGYL